MPDTYSLAKCEAYGRRLAGGLCQHRFAAQPEATLDGPALLQLTPLRQVNLLVLHQLLGCWQHEAEQLRSPYFDFEAPPVREALGQFLNVLSRHLQVGRAALEPLLAQAVATTLLLAADPAAAFERLLLPPASPASGEVPLRYLRERLRYIERGKALWESFVHGLPADTTTLSREALHERFAQHLAAHPAELPPLPPLVAELSALLPLTEADLRADGPAALPAPAPPAAEAEPPATEPLAAELDALPAAAVPTAAPATEPAPPIAEPAPPAPAAAEAPAPDEAPQPTTASDAPAEVPLHEKLKASQPAATPLAASLREGAPGGAATLAERGAPRVGSLREAISINQRYSFINELFGGENMVYHAAIAHLDELPSAEAAVAYVQQELAPRHDWSRKEEHVGRLLKLIERKFKPGA